MHGADRAPAAIVIRRSGDHMKNEKPAGEGNPPTGFDHGVNEHDYSPYPSSLSACNFRHIGDAASKIIEQLAAQLCEVRHE